MITQTEMLKSGWRSLVTPSPIGGWNMATRGTIYYAFSKSAASSVFSSETHLTLQLYFWRPNSAEWWKVQGGKIRISTSLDMPESWLNCDLPHRMIGATLSLIRNTNRNQWCDTCKQRWGQMKDGSWHPKAQMPAYWKVISEHPSRRGVTRFYCYKCAEDSCNWPDGTYYSLKEQLEDALTKYNKGAYYDEQLAQ